MNKGLNQKAYLFEDRVYLNADVLGEYLVWILKDKNNGVIELPRILTGMFIGESFDTERGWTGRFICNINGEEIEVDGDKIDAVS